MFNLYLTIGNHFHIKVAVMEPVYEIDELCVYCFALRVGEFQIYKKKMRRLE